jgi:hypothetical protein
MQLGWNKQRTLRHEVTLSSNTDVLLSLIDPSTAAREQSVPLSVSACAQYSHYAITPARGRHFGPVTCGTVSRPHTFEVVNLGTFPFTLRLFDLLAARAEASGTSTHSPAAEDARPVVAPLERAGSTVPPNKTGMTKTASGRNICTCVHTVSSIAVLRVCALPPPLGVRRCTIVCRTQDASLALLQPILGPSLVAV